MRSSLEVGRRALALAVRRARRRTLWLHFTETTRLEGDLEPCDRPKEHGEHCAMIRRPGGARGPLVRVYYGLDGRGYGSRIVQSVDD